MSYSVMVYRLCLEKLRSILGSGDAVLQREVETAYAQDICRNNEWFARQIEGGTPRLEEALAAVIHGGLSKVLCQPSRARYLLANSGMRSSNRMAK